jgi:hypothetical protein
MKQLHDALKISTAHPRSLATAPYAPIVLFSDVRIVCQ